MLSEIRYFRKFGNIAKLLFKEVADLITYFPNLQGGELADRKVILIILSKFYENTIKELFQGESKIELYHSKKIIRNYLR